MSTRGYIKRAEERGTHGSSSSFLSFPTNNVYGPSIFSFFFFFFSFSSSPFSSSSRLRRAMTFRICGWPVEHLFDLQRYRVPWKTGCGIPISVIPTSRPRLEFARNARETLESFSISDRRSRIGFRVASRHIRDGNVSSKEKIVQHLLCARIYRNLLVHLLEFSYFNELSLSPSLCFSFHSVPFFPSKGMRNYGRYREYGARKGRERERERGGGKLGRETLLSTTCTTLGSDDRGRGVYKRI